MLTVYTSTFCRPDYVSLLACALRKTLTEQYRFVVIVHPGGLRRQWDGVDQVIEGKQDGYQAWQELIPKLSGPSVIMHDDCIPVMPWSSASFPGPHVIRFAGHTIQYHADSFNPPAPVLVATRLSSVQFCASAWPAALCEAATAANAEALLDGAFLHIDKGTIVHPLAEANAAKPALVAAICEHLGCEMPLPLSAEEMTAHPGRQMPAARLGLGDIVKAGLSAVGITEERVSKAIGRPCGCGKRAAAMNKFGAKYLGMPPGRMGNLEPDA